MQMSRTIRIAGIGFAVVLILLGRHLVPKSGSSINNPRPVKDATLAPGPFESLADSLRLRPYPPLQLDARQEKVLAECIKLSRLVNHRVNGVAKFDATTTRDELLTWREQMSPAFYAEFLLAKWHDRQGDASEAERWMKQSLEHAPVVLVRRYELLDGKPLAHTVVGELGVECRMKTRTSANDYEELKYIDLTTDEDGRVYLPCYDTRIRCNSVQHPAGYDVELGRHGYLELEARYNLLPPIRLWPEGRPRPATDLPPSEFYDYRKAEQVEGLRHRVGNAELCVERCYRLRANGAVAATDGREEVELSEGRPHPVFADPDPSLNRAAIQFSRDPAGGHEILRVRLFDHRTRTMLTEYHVPAMWSYDGQGEILAWSLGKPLPERVDVWFQVTTFAEGEAKRIVPPRVGAKAEFAAYDAELTHLHSGERGYTTTGGTLTFHPPHEGDDFPSQATFHIAPKRAQTSHGEYARVLAVGKDGSRFMADRVIYPSNSFFVCEFPIEPNALAHFELLPVGREHCFFFDDVRLPPAKEPRLADRWEVRDRAAIT